MDKYVSVDTIWVLIGAFLVFSMQPGFAMVETGFTRAKNAGNIVMKNVMDMCLGSIVFWVLGFGLMFGTDIGGFIGAPDFFVKGDYGASYPSTAYFIFQTMFCATAATIVSGAMAERTNFLVYCIYSVLISAVIYPISGHWIWGGGWLAQMGFHDFAGSTAVHMVGGVASLVGAKMIGARIGKYNTDGTVNAIPGHSIPLGALGVFLLWFGWFGFNAGSALSSGPLAAHAFATTHLATAFGVAGWLLVEWIRTGKPTSLGAVSGALAGLVVITPAAGYVPFGAAMFMGLVGGMGCYAGILLKYRFHYDDALDVVGIHGIGGTIGALLTGVFACASVNGVDGLLYGNPKQLLWQFISVVATWVYVYGVSRAILYVVGKMVSLRVTPDEEVTGLDLNEHQERGYNL